MRDAIRAIRWANRRMRSVRFLLALVLVACGNAGSSATGGGARPSTEVDLSEVDVAPVPIGNGVPQSSATVPSAFEPLPAGYRETEYLLSGNAALFTGPAAGPVGVESTDHPFVTRILVRAPASSSEFSGTVWVEPFNTSAGGDTDVIWATLAPLVEQRRDAWVGVTVRAGQKDKLEAFDAVRYAAIDFANNGYAWDVLRDIGALLKTNDPKSPFHDLDVRHVYLGGYSQSGVDVATFASAFHEVTRLRSGVPAYDGYLVGAHDGNLTPLQSGSFLIPKFETAPMRAVDVPVIDIEPQTDVEGFAVEIPTILAQQAGLEGAGDVTTPTFLYTDAGGAVVRKPDIDRETDRYRLFEIAGAPHLTGGGGGCDGSSSFPILFFVRAAAASVARWAEEGMAPREAARIELATLDKVSVAANDEYGNAVGGVRSPFVDVPLSRYEVHSDGNPTCAQIGRETPLPADVLRQRYGGAETYMKVFTSGLDTTIENGFLLELDRQTILDAQRQKAAAAFASD